MDGKMMVVDQEVIGTEGLPLHFDLARVDCSCPWGSLGDPDSLDGSNLGELLLSWGEYIYIYI